MTESLRITRARTRLTSPEPIAPERLAAWEAEFASLDGEEMAARWVQPEEWLLIRRLPLHARWRVDEAGIDVGRAWAQALEHAIAEAVARDDGNCVRYRHRRHAVADMVYRSALRDTVRHWAWQRMGLLPRAEASAEDALRAALNEIEHEPELAWPVLAQLLAAEDDTAAFTAALRATGGSLVPRLLKLSPRSAPYAESSTARQVHTPAAERPATALPEALPPPGAQALLHWARSRPALARQHRDTLAALLAAVTAPAPGVAADVLRLRLAQARAAIDAAIGAVPPPPTSRPALADAAPSAEAAPPTLIRDAGAGTRPPAPSALPDLPAAPELPGQPTRWGGALFWLTRLGAAWLALDPLPELSRLLRETALALGVPDGDPALPAFCGGEAPPGEAPPDITELARTLVAGWEAWLLDVAPELPEPRIAAVCQRHGRIVIEPGWITLHLPLESVDTAIRRLALDLDPGWLPWLGCVVRIRYDDA